MKINVLIHKLFAFVLVLFYVLSIGGINVHTCHHTGMSYVTFLAEGTTCEDIHPSDHKECACCHHEHHEYHDGDEDGGCCTNDAHQLLLTGDTHHSSFHKHLSCDAPVVIIPQTPSFGISAARSVETFHSPVLPDSGTDILSSCCILRV